MKRVTDYFSAAPVKKRVLASPTGTHLPSKNASASQHNHSGAPISTAASGAAWNKDNWVEQLDPEVRDLLQLEIDTIDTSWLSILHSELTKPYFLNLKRFLRSQKNAKIAIFPPEKDVYSWSRLTPLPSVKVLILGQDPYHNVGQAHGLAFSVKPPTRAPPSLVNIYKELQGCYPDTFEVPKHGSLVKWAKQGVLMLNACLTVEAHKANSHANRGWEQFTEEVVKAVLKSNPRVVVMAWGSPAAKRVDRARPGPQHLVLKSVHPSPLSASRGWFGTKHFVKANNWLEEQGIEPVDWHLLPKKGPGLPGGGAGGVAAAAASQESSNSQATVNETIQSQEPLNSPEATEREANTLETYSQETKVASPLRG